MLSSLEASLNATPARQLPANKTIMGKLKELALLHETAAAASVTETKESACGLVRESRARSNHNVNGADTSHT